GASLITLDLHSANLAIDQSWFTKHKEYPSITYIPGSTATFTSRANPPNQRGGVDVFNADQLRLCPDSAGADIERMPCGTEESWGTASPRSLHPGGVNSAHV